jgi:hypothetical protein
VKHIYFDYRLFEQGAGQRELEEVVATSSKVCKYCYLVLINTCAWHVSFKVVYYYMKLSLIDRYSFELIMLEWEFFFVFVVIGLQDLLKSLGIKAQLGPCKEKHRHKGTFFFFLSI